MTIEKKIEDLADLQDKIDLFELQKTVRQKELDEAKQALINSILTPEILKQVEEINLEFMPKYQALEANDDIELLRGSKTMLEGELQEEIITLGKSVKGTRINAVYTKPRITWETDKLEGYAEAHPEIEKFKKVGKASVSFRKVAQ